MQQTKEIEVSDGTIISVRRLRIYELDDIATPNMNPYTYKINFGETVIEEEYELGLWSKPPIKPSKPLNKCEEKDSDWFKWREFHLYYGAVRHRLKQKQELAQYKTNIKNYIFENCIDLQDRLHIVDASDWSLLCQAALVPEVTLEDLEAVGIGSFNARYGSQSLLSLFLALSATDEEAKVSGDMYINYLKQWEVDAMMQSGLTEEEWQELSIKERARKIFSINLPKWKEYITYRFREESPGITI